MAEREVGRVVNLYSDKIWSNSLSTVAFWWALHQTIHKTITFLFFHSVQSRMAVGYAPDGSVAPLYDLGWEAPAGQMFSTTDDLNKVCEQLAF